MLQDKNLSWDPELCKRVHGWRDEGLKTPHIAAYLLDMYIEELESKQCNTAEVLSKVKEVSQFFDIFNEVLFLNCYVIVFSSLCSLHSPLKK